MKIISSLEKDITDLQGGMVSSLPNPETVAELIRYTPPPTDTSDFIKIEKPNGIERNLDDRIRLSNIAINPSDRESNTAMCSQQQSHLTRTISVDAPSSSSSKKRKHLAPPATTDIREKHFSSPKFLNNDPCEAGNIFQALEDRGSQQYLWRQHISKNSIKTVSICSESASGGSEGSLSEGDLSSGSAVHSLLHMGRTNSSDSRGSGSGSDESDSAPSNHTATTSQLTQSLNRHHGNVSRVSDKRTVTPAVASLGASPTLSVSTPKTIQAILAACESVSPMTNNPSPAVAATAASPPHAFESLACAQSHPHWRLPERTVGGIQSQTGVDVRIVASTVAAVASIYPITTDTIDSTYRGYIPMKAVDVPGPVALLDGIRNQKFTVYGGNKPHPNYGASDCNALPSRKRCASGSFYDNARGAIPQELDTAEPFPVDPVIQQSLYSVYVPGEMTADDMRHYNLHSLLTKSLSDYSVKKHPTISPLDVIQTPLEIMRSNSATRQPSSETHANSTLDCSLLKSCEVMPPSL